MSRGSAANSITGTYSSVKRVRFGQKSRNYRQAPPQGSQRTLRRRRTRPQDARRSRPHRPRARPPPHAGIRPPLPHIGSPGGRPRAAASAPPVPRRRRASGRQTQVSGQFHHDLRDPSASRAQVPPGGSHATWGYAPASRRRSPAASPPQRKAHDFWPQIAESDAGCPSGKHAPAPLSRRR